MRNVKLKREIEIFLWLLVIILLDHSVLVVFGLLIIQKSLLLLLFLSQQLLSFSLGLLSIEDFWPVPADILLHPVFNFESRHSLHAEYLQPDVVFTWIGVWHSFHVHIMAASCVFNHRIDRCELFGAFGTMEVLRLLMVVQDYFVLESLLTIVTERFQTWHVTTLSAHFLDWFLV